MKHQTWERVLAGLASSAMVFAMPGVQTLIRNYGISAAAAEIIVDDDVSESGEEPQVLDTITLSDGEFDDFVIEGLEEVDNPYLSDRSAQTTTASDSSCPMAVEAYITEESRDTETSEDGSKAQGRVQWARVYVNDYEENSTGESRIRIYLTETESGDPAEEVNTWLFNEYKEELPEKIELVPVTLEDALNGTEDLTIDRIQEYKLDEYGEYEENNNGDYIVTADYLEFTLPAGSYAEFSLALMYYTNAEYYEYQVSAEIAAAQVWDGIEESVLYEDYDDEDNDNELTVTWKPQPESTETEEPAEVPGLADASSEIVLPEGYEPNGSDIQLVDSVETVLTGEDEASIAEMEEASEELTEETGENESQTELSEDGNAAENEDESESESQAELESETEAETELESELETETELESELEAETEAESELESEIESESETEYSEANGQAIVSDVKLILSREDEAANEGSEEGVPPQSCLIQIQAEDLQKDAEYDSIIRIYMKDADTGAPAADIVTDIRASKEAYAEEGSTGSLLSGAVLTQSGAQDLEVERIQTEENGENAEASDYLEFTLPAGSSAEFYVKLLYVGEEGAIKNLEISADAVQLLAAEPVTPEASETVSGQEETGQQESEQETDTELSESETAAETEQAMDAGAEDETAVSASLVEMPSVKTQSAEESTVDGNADEAMPEGGDIQEISVLNSNLSVMVLNLSLLSSNASGTFESKYLYLQTDFTDGNWQDAGALIWMWYDDGTTWAYAQFELISANLMRIKIPDDMVTDGQFVLQRFDPTNPPPALNVWHDGWNRTPRDGQGNISLANAPAGCNTYKITNWDAGEWADGVWNVSDYGGETLYFLDMDPDYTVADLTAEFTVSNDSSVTATVVEMTAVSDIMGLYEVTIPEGAAYDTVTFKEGGTAISTAAILDGTYDPSGRNTFFYHTTKKADGTYIDEWEEMPSKNNASIAGQKLYFDKTSFPVTEGGTILVSAGGIRASLSADDDDEHTFSYVIPADATTATQQTILTFITDEGAEYHFRWSDLSNNAVSLSNEIAGVRSVYVNGNSVFFDATMSKLSYVGTNTLSGANGIPAADSDKVYYYATKADGTDPIYGTMTQAQPPKGSWKDVYKVDLPDGYTKIRFAAYELTPGNDGSTWQNAAVTELLDIPYDTYSAPCFYADTSDDVIYVGGKRDGYWNEVFTIRDAEQYKETDVVDITSGTFTRSSDKMYVSTTFYDYYTDYELNGRNRDSYSGTNGVSQRNWVTFRQFDQALSDYYTENNVQIPLYTGQFQPNTWGTNFGAIASTLNLYGYSDYYNFISVNNSAFGADGTADSTYAKIAKGLVSNNLSADGLPIVKNGDVLLPYFDTAFLTGTNSKNAVLGEIYNNVAFPFTKKDIAGNGVYYWQYDAAEASMALRQDSSTGAYYLENLGSVQDWSQNVDSSSTPTNSGGFFPFNETSAAYDANKYNYGYGAKLEINFRLTEDGTVQDEDGNAVPITFEFSGDDDVWVFIDGKLALDMGGAHAKATGSLNFKDFIATVSGVKASPGDSNPDTVTSFSIEGNRTAEHTLTMFYMERGMWESNMKITFNFPDESTLEVEKEVNVDAVNDLFKGVFDEISIFTFSIKNLATHYGTTEVKSGDSIDPVSIDLDSVAAAPTSTANTFKKETMDGETVLHWLAKTDNFDTSIRPKRYGVLSFDETNISDMQYLQFQLYYDYTDTPTLNNMYLQLVDANGKVLGNVTDSLSGKIYGDSTMAGRTWVTVKIDLSKLPKEEGFDYTKLTQIKFGYNYERNIYLKNFKFSPVATLVENVGFTTKQEDIPDYGSAQSGELEPATGAVYTSDTKGASYSIGEDGTFVLENHETITFRDAFRKGSYIALEEMGGAAFQALFNTSWTMYENDKPVGGMEWYGDGEGWADVINIKQMSVEDGRTEFTIEGLQDGNNYDGSKPEGDTFVFRSYSLPDSDTVLTKLKVVFTNEVNVGSLTIKKEKAAGSQDLDATYTFRVTFTDVGSLALEDDPIVQEATVPVGGSVTIDGIPLGTHFKIEELSDTVGSVIDSIVADPPYAVYYPEERYMQGQLTSTYQNMTVTFTNVKKPVVNVKVQKLWKDANGNDLTGVPDTINVQLQRKPKDAENTPYEAVAVGEAESEIIQLSTLYLENGWAGYWYEIKGLDKYVDFTKAAADLEEYEYRFVEVDDDGTPIETGSKLGIYTVTYETEQGEESDSDQTTVFSTTITNTIANVDLKIKKIDSSTKAPLAGATFTLYQQYSVDSAPEGAIEPGAEGSPEWLPENTEENSYRYVLIGSDQSAENSGLVEFKNLGNGTYFLKETLGPTGYVLSDTVYEIEIDRTRETPITVTKGTETMQISPTETEPENSAYSLVGDTLTIQIENEPVTTELALKKVSSADNTQGLAGAEFALYMQVDPNTDEAVAPSEVAGLPANGTEDGAAQYKYLRIDPTDSDGKTTKLATGADGRSGTIENLANGVYYLVETKAPAGYDALSGAIAITIDRTLDSDSVKITGDGVVTDKSGLSDNTITITIEDTPLTTDLKLVKQDEETKAGLNGVVFNLYKPYTEPAPAENASTPTKAELENGLGSAQNKLYGLVKADGTVTTVSAEGDLTTDADSAAGTAGIIKIGNLSNGTYYLVEKSTIEGYELSDSVITIRIDRTAADEGSRITVTGAGVNTEGLTDGKYTFDGDTVTVTVDNVPLAKVQVTKQDGENKLAGAVFALYKEDTAGDVTSLPTGETGSFTQISDSLTTSSEDAAKGTFTTDYLEQGTYYLVETAAPAGYNKLTSAVKFTVAYSNKKSSVTIESGSGAATGTLAETSSGSHIFAVSISDPPYTGLKIKKTGTDSTGLAVPDMSGVEFNFYRQYASEAAALADGIDAQSILASDNASLAGMNLPTEPSGVVYVLIQELTTDADSIAAITDRQPDGTYYLVETEAKDGFQKLTNPIQISISHAADANLTTSVTADGVAVQKGVDGVYEITVVNSMLDRTNLRIKKVDAQDGNSPLEGVEFELYRQFAEGSEAGGFIEAPYEGMDEDCWYKLVSAADAQGHTEWITDAEGLTSSVEGLESGVYYIVETKAKSGYSLLAMPIKVTIDRSYSEHPIKAEYGNETSYYPTIEDDNTVIITIQNRAKFIFPETGGYGSTIMVLGGLALAGAALFMYILQIRKKRRCTP